MGTPLASSVNTIRCYEDSIGQYVYLYIDAAAYLCVCEVEVYGTKKQAPRLAADQINRAAGQRTWQSSTYSYGASNLAVDENFDVAWAGKSCIRTNSEDHAWWAVDLDQPHLIYR